MAKDAISRRRRVCHVSKLQRTKISTHSCPGDATGGCKPKSLSDTVGLNTKVCWKPCFVKDGRHKFQRNIV